MLRAKKKSQAEILLKIQILFFQRSVGKSLHFGQKFKMHLELVKLISIFGFFLLLDFFLRYCWIGAFSILFILMKSQYFSWKTDASCRSHCPLHIPGFHQVILMGVLNPSHHWVLCLVLILPSSISIPKGERRMGVPFPAFTWCQLWKGNPRAGAKLHPCDLSSIVWVFWSNAGYWLIN